MKENTRNEQFAKVSFWFQDTLNLKPTEALCYALILGFSVRGVWCQFSLSKFAERLNVDRTTASETLKKLVRQGLVTKRKFESNRVHYCHYFARFFNAAEFELKQPHAIPSGSGESPLPQQENTPTGSGESPLPQQENTPTGSGESPPNYIDILNLGLDSEIKFSDYSSVVPDVDIRRITDAWNDLGLGQVQRIPRESKRMKLLCALVNDYGLDAVLATIARVRDSDFLCGQGENGWTANFDWLIKPDNFLKVMEGQYNGKPRNTAPTDYGSPEDFYK